MGQMLRRQEPQLAGASLWRTCGFCVFVPLEVVVFTRSLSVTDALRLHPSLHPLVFISTSNQPSENFYKAGKSGAGEPPRS